MDIGYEIRIRIRFASLLLNESGILVSGKIFRFENLCVTSNNGNGTIGENRDGQMSDKYRVILRCTFGKLGICIQIYLYYNIFIFQGPINNNNITRFK